MEVRPEGGGFESALTNMLGPILEHVGPLAFAGLAVAGLAAATDIGSHFETAFHTIQQETGATGSKLKGLEGDFKTVFASTPGANFKNVADAVGLLNIRTGLTGGKLDDISSKFVELAKITKTDVATDITQVTGLFGQFGISADQQSGKMDVLYKAARDAGVQFGTFASTMQSVVPTAQSLGLSIDQTAAITSNLTKLGLPVSKVMLGMGTAFAKAAKAGKDPTTVIQDMVTAIAKAPNATVATTEAIKNFGLSARSASTFVDAVRSGSLKFGATLADITNGKGGIAATAVATESLGDKWNLMKNKAEVALQPIGQKVLDIAGTLLDKLPGAIDTVKGYWNDLLLGFKDSNGKIPTGTNPVIAFFVTVGQDVQKATKLVKQAWDDLVGGFQNPSAKLGSTVSGFDATFLKIGAIIRKVLPIVQEVAGWLEAHWKPILIAAGAAFAVFIAPIPALIAGLVYAYERFKTFRVVVDDVVKWLRGTAYPDVHGFLRDVVGAVEWAAKWWDDHWHQIKNVVAPIVDFLKREIGDMLHIINDLWSAGADLLSGRWGKLWSDITGAAGHAWDLIQATVSDGIRVVWNLIKDLGPTLLKLAADAWNMIDKALTDVQVTLFKDVTAIPGTILSKLGDADKLLYDFGANVLKGLIKGVEDALGGIGNVVKDIKDKFTSALTSLFKLGSPSRLTYQHGTWIAQGLALGITENTHLVTDALKALPGFSTGPGGAVQVQFGNLPHSLPTGVGQPVGSGSVTDKLDKTNQLLEALTAVVKEPALLAPGMGSGGSGLTGPAGTVSQGQAVAPGRTVATMRTLSSTRQR